MKKYYITTPIYYVNDVPHIGHAYTTIAADVLARYHKSKGSVSVPEDVFFLTGVDEHGAKIAEAASKAGKKPKQFVDELAPRFQEAWRNLNIEYSEFFRTTDPRHEELVREFVQKLVENGFVEKRKYEGLYCISCERYYKPEELIDGKCPDHKRECVRQSEENYFFLLSKIQDRLLAQIESGKLEIGPESRKNEVVSKIKLGLEDVSISRANVEWGIPFPGDKSQTIYVWVDALLNYWTATKIYTTNGRRTIRTTNDKNGSTEITSEAAEGLLRGEGDGGQGGPVWPADLHLMAKDILWFHAVIWPAMLIAAGEETPRKVFAHGFFTINGQKMSKTIGNVIDPNEVVKKFGPDAVRYALLREFPFGEDGDISVEKIGKRYEEDLGNNLGNFVNRTISMINRYEWNKRIKLPDTLFIDKQKLNQWESSIESGVWAWGSSGESDLTVKIPEGSGIRNTINGLLESLYFDTALIEIMELSQRGNAFLNKLSPWKLAGEEQFNVLDFTYEIIFSIAELLFPFMPDTSKRIKDQLETLKPEPLFPRIEA